MQITKLLCPTSKYSIKCPDVTEKKGITVHNTYNDASAMAEASYMLGRTDKVSFHAAVDDYRIVECLPLDRSCYAAGDGRYGFGNANTINIEICYSLSGGIKFAKAEKIAAEYIAYLLKARGWGIDKVGTHQMRSGKYCPHRTLDMGWQRFLNMVQSELDVLNRQALKFEDIYSEDIYASKYGEELKQSNLWEHLNTYGIKEGRTFSYVFDAKYYRDKYEDLRNAYGNDYQGLFAHFITYGFYEGRAGSPIYEGNFYKKHPDLFKRNVNDLMAHFLMWGMQEGRQASEDFNPIVYKENNSDLKSEFGNNMKEYFRHYMIFGMNENRICK